MLKISLVALMGCTWVFWSFLFASRPEETDVDTLTSLVRLPASIPAQIPGISNIPGLQKSLPGVAFAPPTSRAAPPIEMDIVKVPCWDKTDEVENETSARWVRLVGKNCESDASSDTVTVRNLTNGYVATVFPTQLKGMTTDFIPLQAGKNEILIRFNQGAGVTTESQVSFIRE